MKYLSASFMIYISFIAVSIEAKTIRVPSDYPTIQQGIDSANSGDMVLVAKGTYTGTGSGYINLKNGIYLKSEEGPESTVINWGVLKCSNLNDTVVIDGFTISSCYYGFYGGAICSQNSNVIIRNNIIRDNYLTNPVYRTVAGAGIYVKGGVVLIENNIIRNNTAHGDYVLKNKTQYTDAGGGGIYAESATVTIRNNVISGNCACVSDWYGGGIACLECVKAVIFNNLIDSNYTKCRYGGGLGDAIYCTGPVTITNNTFVNNGIDTTYTDTANYRCYGGIYCDEASTGQDSIIIRNNIFAFDSSSKAGAIYCSDSLDLSKIFIGYNDFYQNAIGNFYNPPTGVGNFSWGTNRNGNPCDSFYNINIDPGFTTGPLGTYYQQNVSGCGDYIVNDEFKSQGGNTLDGKPDTGWVDLGYHYGVLAAVEESSANPQPPTPNPYLSVSPNPFTSSTTIKLSTFNSQLLTLSIYTISGRCVKTLVNEQKPAGIYNVNLTTKDLSTGIYFITLSADKFKTTKKLIFMK